MLCQSCGKKEATTYYQETVNGKTKQMQLCADCAHKLAGAMSNSMSFWQDDFFQNPWGAWEKSLFGSPKQAIGGGRTCPTCGMTESELRRTGRVGCGNCYQNFQDILLPYIKKLHGAATHVGTMPNQQEQNPLDELKNRLQQAVDSENYEEAAKLRDEIRRQEGEQNA